MAATGSSTANEQSELNGSMDRAAAPYLSVVVTTRNDDHGGDPLKRLQALVNTFDAQCRRYGVDAELIVIEWNPPADRPSVGSLVRLPESACCTYRFIDVPPALHQRLQYADVLPLFQMIAKNVGIRRARGRFVLATNIDIIFSNELIEFIGLRQLRPGCLYRVDRHDIQPDLPLDATLDAQMEYCASHQLRVHTRWGSYPVDASGERTAAAADDIVDGRMVRLGSGWHVREGAPPLPFYRWASDRVELILNPEAGGLVGAMVLDVEIQTNPYDPGSVIEVAAAEGERILARTRVVGQARFAVPLDPSPGGERRIELRVSDRPREGRRRLPAFERRDELHYRVTFARLRAPAPADRDTFEYPLAGWANAHPSSMVEIHPVANGVAVTTDPRKYSYCVDYGPLRAPYGGLFRFVATCSVLEGGIFIGVIDGDRNWLPVSINRPAEGGSGRFEIAFELRDAETFWILVANDHPEGNGASKFVIHRLEGSANPSVTWPHGRPARPRLLSRPRRWRPARVADALGRVIAAMLGRRLLYRVARAAAEFAEVETALRASDEQLRATAPLQYLGDFNTFLRDQRPDNLHVNGCGDFQLMALEHWEQLCGYPELETFSMNIDGLFSYMADAAGIKERVLDLPIYHLEHEVGSGWSPEGEALLRRRIAERGITWLDASTVYIWAAYMRWLRRPIIFNQSGWGFADAALPETVHSPGSAEASR